MAGPTVSGKKTEHPEAAVEKLREEHNKLVDDLETLRANVVANTAATTTEAELTAGKVDAS